MKPEHHIFCGDSLEVLKNLPNESINSLVTDPPAGIGFIGLDWDKDKGGREEWIAWLESIMFQCHRVMKPGGHGFVWALPRTSHWTATALENSGFLVKDIVTHVSGSGFPKNLDIQKSISSSRRLDLTNAYKVSAWIREQKKKKNLRNRDIDKHCGTVGCASHWVATPPNHQVQIPSLEKWEKIIKLIGSPPKEIQEIVFNHHRNKDSSSQNEELLAEAEKWRGWGTALKPCSEHWILIQKPIRAQNIAANTLKYGTGGINVDASRIESSDIMPRTKNIDFSASPFFGKQNDTYNRTQVYEPHEKGRFPSNFVMTRGEESCPVRKINSDAEGEVSKYFKVFTPDFPFVYKRKPLSKEKGEFNHHPTVKPMELMEYLVRMVTPPGGIVLDPFMGSASTGVASVSNGFRFLGIEKNPDYFEICQRRLNCVSTF